MTRGVSPASDFAVALLNEFAGLGVRDVVLSPGSRSQALALAAVALAEDGRLRLSVRIDERVAGFLALGLAVETRAPVLVVTTSGTAVANLHPAVLEARHSGVPLILLTADRPSELRGVGANQTTEQVGLFGPAVNFVRDVEPPLAGAGATDPDEGSPASAYAAELAHEAYSAASGHSSAPGPVQLNLAFREPLSAPLAPGDLPPLRPRVAPAASAPRAQLLPAASGTIVIAGHAAGARAEEFAREAGAPLIAEASSGARFGPNLVVAYRELLADERFAARVRRAVVFGHPTLSREVPALLTRGDVDVVTVRGPGFEAYDPSRRALVVDAVAHDGPPAERAWAAEWVHESRRLLERAETDAAASAPAPREPFGAGPAAEGRAAQSEFSRQQLAAFRAPVTRRMLVDAVWRATWPHDRLVLGASRLIRDLDRTAPGKRIPVHANRGLSGIDGTIATAAGIALASQAAGSPGVTRVLLGDLTLLHDAGALLFGAGEPRPRLQVIVGNDGGGTIFDGLEVADGSDAAAFDRVMYTPHAVEVAALAAAYRWRHIRAANRGELDEALAPVDAPTLVEVPLPR